MIILIIVLAITMPIVAGIVAFTLVGKADAKYRNEWNDWVARNDRKARRDWDDAFAIIDADFDARMKASSEKCWNTIDANRKRSEELANETDRAYRAWRSSGR